MFQMKNKQQTVLIYHRWQRASGWDTVQLTGSRVPTFTYSVWNTTTAAPLRKTSSFFIILFLHFLQISAHLQEGVTRSQEAKGGCADVLAQNQACMRKTNVSVCPGPTCLPKMELWACVGFSSDFRLFNAALLAYGTLAATHPSCTAACYLSNHSTCWFKPVWRRTSPVLPSDIQECSREQIHGHPGLVCDQAAPLMKHSSIFPSIHQFFAFSGNVHWFYHHNHLCGFHWKVRRWWAPQKPAAGPRPGISGTYLWSMKI